MMAVLSGLVVVAAELGHHGMSHGRRLKAEWPNEATWQARAIFAERLSPTTDAISFSPRSMKPNCRAPAPRNLVTRLKTTTTGTPFEAALSQA